MAHHHHIHSSMGHVTESHASMGQVTENHASMGHVTGSHASMGNMTGSHGIIHNMTRCHNSTHHMTGDHDSMGDMTGSHDMNDSSGCDSMEMMTYFHTGKCEYILFKDLYTETTKAMVGACFVIFVLAILYEGIKVLREHLLRRAMIAANKYSVTSSTANGSKSQEVMSFTNKNLRIHMMSYRHFVQTFLHVLQVFISYCLMLVFMTYNAWLCLSVILGVGVGYFLFGWRKAIVVDLNEHCN